MLEKEKREIIEEVKKELLTAPKMQIEVCREGIDLPKYAHDGDSGMDLRSAIDIEIKPGETLLVPTGLKVAIPEGYELQIRPRSGLSLKTSLKVSLGTIDSGYRDELGIIVTNASCIASINDENDKTYKIAKGDRIAQMVLTKFEYIDLEEVCEGKLENLGKNRGGGFGHSGVK